MNFACSETFMDGEEIKSLDGRKWKVAVSWRVVNRWLKEFFRKKQAIKWAALASWTSHLCDGRRKTAASGKSYFGSHVIGFGPLM